MDFNTIMVVSISVLIVFLVIAVIFMIIEGVMQIKLRRNGWKALAKPGQYLTPDGETIVFNHSGKIVSEKTEEQPEPVKEPKKNKAQKTEETSAQPQKAAQPVNYEQSYTQNYTQNYVQNYEQKPEVKKQADVDYEKLYRQMCVQSEQEHRELYELKKEQEYLQRYWERCMRESSQQSEQNYEQKYYLAHDAKIAAMPQITPNPAPKAVEKKQEQKPVLQEETPVKQVEKQEKAEKPEKQPKNAKKGKDVIPAAATAEEAENARKAAEKTDRSVFFERSDAETKSFSEKYSYLSDERRDMLDKLFVYVMEQEGVKKSDFTNMSRIKYKTQEVFTVKIKRGVPVLCFRFATPELAQYVEEEDNKNVKITPVTVSLNSEKDYSSAVKTIDMAMEQAKSDYERKRSRRNELRRTRRALHG